MENASVHLEQIQVEYLEYLNDLGYNIVYIGGTFYLYTEFEPYDGETFFKTYVQGRNVTSKIMNAINVANRTTQLEHEVRGVIEPLTLRAREFSGGVQWQLFLSKTF